ncbi:MAG: tetratricopeptide repeat protein [Theionarchaea archaeon]|nr:tetratricopeptide repeat protein [Theionarchaea archaeon]
MKLELDVKREGREFKVEARSPLDKKSGFFELDPSLYSKIGTIQQAIEEQEHLDEAFVKNLGIQLFQMLFSDIKELFHECLNSERVDVILNTDDIELSVLPWELCYDEDDDMFLGADSHCSLVRRDQTSARTFGRIDYPLRVLIIVSSPMDLDEKGEYQPDPDEIMELMAPLKEMEKKGMVTVDFLERASIKCIQDKLKTGYHIVHFIGHGSYHNEKGKGYLIIEDKQRNSKKMEGSQVARLFGVNPPQLLILTACESSPLIPFLLTKRIPAVMAMQYTVLKDIAHQFIERFYSLLLKGDTTPQAVSSAREAVSLEEGITHPGWFTPALYMRSESILNINTDSVPTPPPKTTVERVDMDKDLIGAENFVGRRKDLWLVEEALCEDNLKMVVVTGIGGIGKSALAKKFVNRHRTKFKGVLGKKMVDPKMGVEGILVVLDQFLLQNGEQRFHAVMEEPSLDLKLEVLNNCLKAGYLVVLDNFEVLIEDSHIRGKDIEKFVQGVLFGDHSSKVIITSRYQFTFRDEKGGGLVKYVDLSELSFQFARQLLENQEITDIEIQKGIYRKVGGNPQFLESFAGLAKTRTSERLLEDLTPVREKIGEWLLNELVGELHEEAVSVLKMFSVFRRPVERGAFDVLGADGDIIDKLVYYSLVKVDKGIDDMGNQYVYYSMHQGVRDYCHSLFSGDEKITAHAEAAEYYRIRFEKERADFLDIFELHYHLFESEQYEEAGNLIEDIFESLYMWGFREELIGLLVQTIKTTAGETKAWGLFDLAKVLDALGNYKEAEKYYTQSLELAESLGDKQGIAISLHQLGMLQYGQGNYKEAEKYYTQSLELAESLGDKQGIAISLGQLGNLQEDQGNYKEAEKYYTQSLELTESLGDKQGIASSLHQLGNLQYGQGNYKEAEKYYTQSLELAESLGDKQGIASSLHQLGILQEDKESYKEAVEYYITSLAIFLELNSPDAETVIKSLKRVKNTIGGEFDTYWKTVTNQEVPDFLEPTYEEQMEDFIQYIMYVVDMNEHEDIERATETLTELLKESSSDEKQLFQFLLDYINRKDISQKIKELPEPFKSILEEYFS